MGPEHFVDEMREWREVLRRTGFRHTHILPDHEQPTGEDVDQEEEKRVDEASAAAIDHSAAMGAMVDRNAVARALLGITPPEKAVDGERSEA